MRTIVLALLVFFITTFAGYAVIKSNPEFSSVVDNLAAVLSTAFAPSKFATTTSVVVPIQTGTPSGNTSPSQQSGSSNGTAVTLDCTNANALVNNLGLGSSGGEVTALQTILQTLYPSTQITGYYGSLTQSLVQQFQATHGIASSGTPASTGYGGVGPKTIAALKAATKCAPNIGVGAVGTTGTAARIYVATPQITPTTNRGLSASTYALSYIDGIAIRIAWSVIEPQQNTYDWSALDPIVTQAVQNGKKLSIGVGTGDNAPSWLYSSDVGVPYLTLSEANSDGSTCSTLTEPIPWNSAYETAYANMMSALAAHLKSLPGAYSAVSVVKVTGMNQDSEELHISSEYGQNPLPCQTDDVTLWQNAGYLPSEAEDAWSSFANSVATAFPGRAYIQVLFGNAFPPIDENGNINHNLGDADPEQVILATGLSRYGSQFGGLFDALAIDPLTSVGQLTVQTAQQGGIGAYQTNDYGGPTNGAECGTTQRHGSGDKALCTNATYQQILQNGVSNYGTYFEIWEVNAVAFPDAITAIQKELNP